MRKRPVLLLALCLALPAPGAGAKKGADAHLPKKYEDSGFTEARFACRAPAQWKKIRSGELDPAEKVRGVVILGPQGRGGFAPTISVYYYEPDNPEFENADAYIATHHNPAMRAIAGEDVEKPKALEVAGLPARAFRRSSYEYVPRHAMDTRDLKKQETHIILDYEGGFFALTYSAPTEDYSKWLPVFERVVETFKPVPLEDEPAVEKPAAGSNRRVPPS